MEGRDLAIAVPRKKKKPVPAYHRGLDGPGWFEIRLFYVRVSSCPLEEAPQVLTLRHLHMTGGQALEINGSRVVHAEAASLTLRRDRMDKESAEATYVSTDNVRTAGTLEFGVYDRDDLLLCGALERSESNASANGNNSNGSRNNNNNNSNNKDQGLERFDGLNQRICWSMDCYSALGPGGCAFLKGKRDFAPLSAPAMEVYVAGCFAGSPLILTKVVELISWRKPARRGTLDSIPEDEEADRVQDKSIVCSSHSQQFLEGRDYTELDEKVGPGLDTFYPEGEYIEGDDGELSWFNAGVRVGVGIGLGMCLGIGIGVGLLMRTYQATARTFRRRLL